jgi:hypothetical protein
MAPGWEIMDKVRGVDLDDVGMARLAIMPPAATHAGPEGRRLHPARLSTAAMPLNTARRVDVPISPVLGNVGSARCWQQPRQT